MTMVGFIGLGRMGRPMASNLCRKGFRLVVYDIDPAAMRELEMLQARPAADAAQLATENDVVVTMLPDSATVEEVVAESEGALAHARRGALVMDMSTIDPLVTDRLAAAAGARGIGFVVAPAGRLASHVDRGESLFMVDAPVRDRRNRKAAAARLVTRRSPRQRPTDPHRRT